MTRKDKFKKLFKNFMNEGAEYIGVFIKVSNLEQPELILNKACNAEKKLEYYLNAYNNDMQLKTENSIEMLSVTGAIYLEDLEDNARVI